MKITAVRQGDNIVLPVYGGVRRKPAPADGFVVEDGDTNAFVSLREFEVAYVELKLLLEKPRARRRARR
jgi:D-hexose-6-phosphate mutarotase